MKTIRTFTALCLIIQFLFLSCYKSQGAFNVQGVELFKDNNVCIIMAGSSTPEGLNLTSLTVTTESVQSKISSSGSFCSLPPFFTGGASLTTVNGVTTQADPTVQGLGRGILISEIAGDSGEVSSSGNPTGFNTLANSFGGIGMTIFEISLPTGCDVIDDDDDIAGSSSDLSTINDFSFITCTSTTGITVTCNDINGLLTAANGLIPATSTSPAKIRFVISDINTAADGNMIDSILVRLDSQDIFCPSNTTNPLSITVIAKNAVDSPTASETLGTTSIGTATQATKIIYAPDTVTSQKGEISVNEVGVTPVLTGGNTTTANTIQIEELNNEGIPIGGQASPTIINPLVSNSTAVSAINIWLIPPYSDLFSQAPSSSDISFLDDSLVIASDPYIVRTNTDDFNAPIGTLVIPIKLKSGSTDPSTVKTVIKIKNIILAQTSSSTKDSIISLSFFEPISGAIVNTPGAASIFSSATTATNPQNFSSFAPSSVKGTTQNAIISGAVNNGAGALQITTDADLSSLTVRDTILGTPQITSFTKVISSLTDIDTNKINITNSNSVLTITGNKDASISGAKIKIESLTNGQSAPFDSVTVISKSDGSFTAKLKADSSNGTVNLKQTVSGTDSKTVSKSVSQDSSTTTSCEKTVCGCTNTNCTPNITSVLTFVQNNGGLSQIVSAGGALLQEIINSAKKALGLS